MKRLFAAAIAAGTVGVSSAAAADVSSAAADSFYIGLHAGIASLSADWELQGAGTYTGDISDSGFIGGVHAGFMHSFDQFMLGIEGDLSFTDLSEGFDGFEGIGVELDSLASLRIRAGWMIDNIMPYITAGVAHGDFEYTHFFLGPFDSDNDSRFGFVGGGGVEIMFTEAWSGRAELLYYDFGSSSGTFGPGYSYDVDSDVTVVRAGLSYNFGM